MFGRSGNVILINMVGVFTLKSFHNGFGHAAAQIGIFAIVFPLARPTLVAAEVECGRKRPRHTAGARFVGCNLGSLARHFGIEGCSYVDVLWEHRAAGRVGSTVVLVQPEQRRNARMLQAFILQKFQVALPLFLGGGGTVGRV